MNPAVSPDATPATFKKAGLRETSALLAVAWFVPLAIHLVPWSAEPPLGAFLLPMFWTTFVAAYFYGAGIGLLIGLFAPICNRFVTGMPAWDMLGSTSFELAFFAVTTAWVVRCGPRVVLLAPLGCVAAKAVTAGLEAMTPVFGGARTPAELFAKSLINGLAGLVVLAAINAALVWFYPKPAGGKR